MLVPSPLHATTRSTAALGVTVGSRYEMCAGAASKQLFTAGPPAAAAERIAGTTSWHDDAMPFVIVQTSTAPFASSAVGANAAINCGEPVPAKSPRCIDWTVVFIGTAAVSVLSCVAVIVVAHGSTMTAALPLSMPMTTSCVVAVGNAM